MSENTLNHRGNQPGTGSPAPISLEPPPDRTVHRGIEPGAIGAPPAAPATAEEAEAAPRAADAALYGILDPIVLDVVREDKAVLCPVKGCEYGAGKSPFQTKSIVGLRSHVRARHKNVDDAVVMRVMTQILKEDD